MPRGRPAGSIAEVGGWSQPSDAGSYWSVRAATPGSGAEDDEAVFVELFEQTPARVYRYVRRHCDDAECDDVVPEVFHVASRRLADVPPDAVPWLLATARNVVGNHWRSSDRADVRSGWGGGHGGAPPHTVSGGRSSARSPRGRVAMSSRSGRCRRRRRRTCSARGTCRTVRGWRCCCCRRCR